MFLVLNNFTFKYLLKCLSTDFKPQFYKNQSFQIDKWEYLALNNPINLLRKKDQTISNAISKVGSKVCLN